MLVWLLHGLWAVYGGAMSYDRFTRVLKFAVAESYKFSAVLHVIQQGWLLVFGVLFCCVQTWAILIVPVVAGILG
jgi:hypothetical protein